MVSYYIYGRHNVLQGVMANDAIKSHYDVETTSRRRFDVMVTLLSRRVHVGKGTMADP